MKKKKSIIYACVGAVVIIGFVISYFVEWPIDYNNASGDIAKSSHFSRQLADAGVSNMQELLQNDEEFKNGLVTAYLVMKTRAEQFNALVDMSAKVAGDITEFESVLKDMKETQPMINNVITSMEAAGKDLNAALDGETAGDLEQNTSNATLAYSTLQKQNKLADQFIVTTDEYLKKEGGNDRLKFVRDQWLDYQQVTAALDKNEQLAQELGKKGYQLSEDKRAATLGSFDVSQQLSIIYSTGLGIACNVEGLSLSNTLSTLDAALSAQQKIHILNATEQGSLNAVEQSSLRAVDQGVLSAVEQNALNAIQQGELGNVLGILVRSMEQGGMIGAIADQGKLGAVADQGKLGAVVDQGKLGALVDQGKLGALERGGLNVLSLSLGGLENLQGSFNSSMIGNVETGGVNMLGMSRQFDDFIDAIGRPGINE